MGPGSSAFAGADAYVTLDERSLLTSTLLYLQLYFPSLPLVQLLSCPSIHWAVSLNRTRILYEQRNMVSGNWSLFCTREGGIQQSLRPPHIANLSESVTVRNISTKSSTLAARTIVFILLRHSSTILTLIYHFHSFIFHRLVCPTLRAFRLFVNQSLDMSRP